MRLAAIIGSSVAAAGALVRGVWMLQNRLIYFPGPDPGPPVEPWTAFPAATDDGLGLVGWSNVPGTTADRPIVVVFPGNAGNRATRLPLGNALAGAGYGVVLCEYRGYGGNPGSPDEPGILADARAFLAAIHERIDPPGGIVYFGESLGAAVAIAMAAERAPDALVLGSPFTSLVDVARVHYPLLPAGVLLRDRYPSIDRIATGALDGIPTLVIAGTGDRVVPYEQSRAIAIALGADTFTVPGAGHNDPSIRSSPAMVEEVARFVTRTIGRPPEADGGTAVRP